MDMTCGSGSLLLNVRKKMNQTGGTIGKILGQEKNITTYNLARMNMLLLSNSASPLASIASTSSLTLKLRSLKHL